MTCAKHVKAKRKIAALFFNDESNQDEGRGGQGAVVTLAGKGHVYRGFPIQIQFYNYWDVKLSMNQLY